MAGVSTVNLPLIINSGYIDGTSDVTLLAIRADDGSQLALPSIAATSTAVTGNVTSPTETTHVIPAITGTGTAGNGGIGISNRPVPPIVATGHGPGISESNVPNLTAEGAGVAGQIGISACTLPSVQAAGTATTQRLSVSTSTVPAFTGTGTGLLGGVGVSNATLARIIVAAQGYTGAIGTSTIVLPIYEASGTGYGPIIGTSTVVLPLIIAQATGLEPAATVHYAVAMHTETMAVTTYSNYPFNSFAAFNGIYLAAGDAGLFALTGATDDGTFIDAAMRVGITDFGDSHLKRVPRMYIGYRTDGDLILRVITDEAHTRDYPLRSTGVTGIHGAHVKIGKGVNARYWQFEIRNTNGADFELNAIEAKPILSARRIGGRDA